MKNVSVGSFSGQIKRLLSKVLIEKNRCRQISITILIESAELSISTMPNKNSEGLLLTSLEKILPISPREKSIG